MKYLNPAEGRRGLPTFQDPSGMQLIGPVEEPFGPIVAPPGGFQIGPVPIQIPGFPTGFQLPPILAPGPLRPIRAQPLPPPPPHPIVAQPTPQPILVIPGPQPTPGPAPIVPGPQPTPAPLPGPQPFTVPTPVTVPQPGGGPSGGGGFFNPQPFNVPVPVTPFPVPGPQGGGGFFQPQPGPQPQTLPQPQPLPGGQTLTINADPPAALEPSFASVDPRFQMERFAAHVCPQCGGELEAQQVELPIGTVIQDGRVVPPCDTCPR